MKKSSFLKHFKKNSSVPKKIKFSFMLGLVSLSTLILTAVLAPLLRPYDPLSMDLSLSLKPPSLVHPFGMDENGIDLLSQVLFGARVSLLVSFTVVFISAFLGLLIGSISAWNSRIWDPILMRIVDLFSAFPRFLLALAILAMMGSSIENLILAMCISGWTSFARLARAEILHLKKEEYVLSALAFGLSPIKVVVRHIWPNLFGIFLAQMAFSLIAVVIAEAGLSFLGLGVPPETPSWGALLNSGRNVLDTAPHLTFFPALALFSLIFSFQLLGEGLKKRTKSLA